MICTEFLKEVGVDYDAGLKRFLNDPELYEAVLSAFAGDDTLERAQAAFAKGDPALLLRVVHEAKGASGNAGLDGVYAEASALVKLLRSDAYTEDALAEGFRRFESAYATVRAGVRAALA